MSDADTIDETRPPPAESTGSELALIETLTPAIVFAPGGVDSILQKLEAEVRSVETDISTPAGRKAIASLAYKVARSKTLLDDMGKKLTDQWRLQAETVHAERRTIIARLDALKDKVRKPLTEWEESDKLRIVGHEAAVRAIIDLRSFDGDDLPPTADIEARLAQAREVGSREWQEFAQRASRARADTCDALSAMLNRAKHRDEQAAEAERLRAEEAESQRLETERLQAEHDARVAAEAAERARREADERAAAEAEAERQRVAAREAAAAEAAAQERQRILDAAEAERVAAEHERERVETERKAAEDRAAKVEADAKAAAEKAERDRQEAAQAATLAREQAQVEADRRQQQAIETERQRVADEKAREGAAAKRRADNIAHARKVNNASAAAIVKAMAEVHSGNAEEAQAIAQAIVVAIARGQVPHISISY